MTSTFLISSPKLSCSSQNVNEHIVSDLFELLNKSETLAVVQKVGRQIVFQIQFRKMYFIEILTGSRAIRSVRIGATEQN